MCTRLLEFRYIGKPGRSRGTVATTVVALLSVRRRRYRCRSSGAREGAGGTHFRSRGEGVASTARGRGGAIGGRALQESNEARRQR